MQGLTVRWSLEHAAEGVERRLADYVSDSSHARFTGMPGLRFKTWRLRPGEWFEGCYVFADSDARDLFEKQFSAGAADSPVSTLVGAAPVLIEPCEIVAVADGGAGFLAAASY